MHVLLIEDDILLGQAIESALARWHHSATWVRTARAALDEVCAHQVDLILLDLGLPDREGRVVLDSLRAKSDDVPVIVITAREAVHDRVESLDAGADDYLTKPFHLSELAARMRALYRRSHGQSRNLIVISQLTIDPSSTTVTFRGEPVDLSHQEFVVLRTLAERAGRAVQRESLLNAMYGREAGADSNTLEVHIHTLRRKLGNSAIRTVRGFGYILVRNFEP